MNNVLYLYNEIIDNLESIFYSKYVNIPKKFKKKKGKKIKKYILKTYFIKKEKRHYIISKWVYLYSALLDHRGFFNRVFGSFLETVIEKKESFLYKKKIICYKKILKKNITR